MIVTHHPHAIALSWNRPRLVCQSHEKAGTAGTRMTCRKRPKIRLKNLYKNHNQIQAIIKTHTVREHSSPVAPLDRISCQAKELLDTLLPDCRLEMFKYCKICNLEYIFSGADVFHDAPIDRLDAFRLWAFIVLQQSCQVLKEMSF